MKRIILVLLLVALTVPVLAQIAVTVEKPGLQPGSDFGWQVLTGAKRRIHANVTVGGTQCTVGANTCQLTWAIVSDGSGGASITAAASPNIPGAYIDLTAGPTGGTCTHSSCLTGTSAIPIITSPNVITITATSVDDGTKSFTFTVGVYAGVVQVFVSPFNVRAYSGQQVDLQSWVWGSVDDNVTWAITQPGGGNGALIAPPAGGSASTARDALFSATVAGDYIVTATSVADNTKSATAIVSVSGNTLPSYASTLNHTTPVDCSVNPASGNIAYDVGPTGHTYTSIAAVFTANPSWIGSHGYPEEPAGTTIQIYNTDLTGISPTRYHEYLRLDGQGTQTQPIRIVGCPDSIGNLPIIDGQNATAYSSLDNSVAAGIIGLYQIGIHHSNAAGGYPTMLSPSYIIVEGLAFRNAYLTVQPAGSPNSSYFAPGSGSPTQWPNTTACIRFYEGNHSTIRGNDMEDCSFGTLTDFNGSNNGWGGLFADSDVEGNYFTNIGANNQSEHMAYIQGYREVAQFNVFDKLKSVSQAGDLKLRGIGDIVRYNWFNQSTNTRTLDFVEEQDSNIYMSFLGYYYTPSGGTSFRNANPTDAYTPNLLVAGDEMWHKAYAYGNVFNMGPGIPPSAAPIHFFGDQSPYVDQNTNPPVRVGTLYDYSNSIYFAGGGVSSPPNFNFVDTMQNRDNQIRWEWPFLTIANNAAFSGPLNNVANQAFQWTTQRMTNFDFGANWISSNWGNNTQTCVVVGCWAGTGWPYYQETTQPLDGGNLPAHIAGFSNVIIGGTTAPFNTTTFIPTVGGGLIGTGTTLPASVTNMPVRFQISSSYIITPRTRPLDLGAIDGTSAPPSSFQRGITGHVIRNGTIR